MVLEYDVGIPNVLGNFVFLNDYPISLKNSVMLWQKQDLSRYAHILHTVTRVLIQLHGYAAAHDVPPSSLTRERARRF